MVFCSECRFWDAPDPNDKYDTTGRCCIERPTVVVIEDSRTTAWPETKADDWCAQGRSIDPVPVSLDMIRNIKGTHA